MSSLHILTPRRLDDVSNPDADAFIAFGLGNWPNHAVDLLCEIEFTPLCSPSLLNKLGGLSKPQDVLRSNLLHLGDFEDWSRWFSATRVENPDPEGGIVFSDMNLVFSAAIAGQGIAMGDELTSRTGTGRRAAGAPLRHRNQIAALLFPGHRARQGGSSCCQRLRQLAEVASGRNRGRPPERPMPEPVALGE